MNLKLSITNTLAPLALMITVHCTAQEKDSIVETPTEENWNNFKERDAAVYSFSFCVPKEYVASVRTNRDSKVLSEVSTELNLSYFAKYYVFQILEEELGKKTNKKFSVADPMQVPTKIIPSNSACSSSHLSGFSQFPGWMFKNFLKYDEEAEYLVEVSVNIAEKARLSANIGAEKLKPVCSISITIYDREKNRIGKYSYTKKDFGSVRVHKSSNYVYDRLLNSIWKVDSTTGIQVSDIVGIYVVTLQEMMENTVIELQ